jgi:hypothetical protein
MQCVGKTITQHAQHAAYLRVAEILVVHDVRQKHTVHDTQGRRVLCAEEGMVSVSADHILLHLQPSPHSLFPVLFPGDSS